MTRRRVRQALAGLTLVALLAGCGTLAPDNSGGPGLPQQRAGESYPGARGRIRGEFTVADNGCFLLRIDGQTRFVIWPKDATSGGAAVVLADGVRVEEADRLDGIGVLVPVERLAEWPDGYWGSTVGFCDPKAERVVVLESVRVAD